ncbi:MAG TPA: PASTA domain-containing protein [Vicinamibacterales bacterium]|nr:PASTA domain-containing protein [Vicinamibacterales bacterium]
MPLGTRVWKLGKLLLLAGALGLTFLVFFGIAMRAALKAREVRVPGLVGSTVPEATRSLGSLGLGLRVDDTRRPDEHVPTGHIMQQEPGQGALARQQRSVRVWVSSGPRATIVPQLAAQTERTARIRLEQGGLTIASVSEIRSTAYPADTVIAQDPPAATMAPGVSLLVNRGEEGAAYVMPDVIGIDGTRAADTLRKQGLRVTVVGSQPYPGVPAGTVVRQRPSGGFKVTAADAVSLEVSR